MFGKIKARGGALLDELFLSGDAFENTIVEKVGTAGDLAARLDPRKQ